MADPIGYGKPVDQAASASGYGRVGEEFAKRDLTYVLDQMPDKSHVRSAEHDPVKGTFRVEYDASQTVELSINDETPAVSLKVAQVVSGHITPDSRRIEIDSKCLTASVFGGTATGTVKEISSDTDGNITMKAGVTIGGWVTREMTETFHPNERKTVAPSGIPLDVHSKPTKPAYLESGPTAKSAQREEAQPSRSTYRTTSENASGGAYASASSGSSWTSRLSAGASASGGSFGFSIGW